MENIETAILLMVVGMATVFVILLIVIYLQVRPLRSGSCEAGSTARSYTCSGKYFSSHYCCCECSDTG